MPNPPPFFPDVPVLGSLPPAEIQEALRAMVGPSDESDDGEKADKGMLDDLFGFGGPRPWQHTAHQLGFIAPGPVGSTVPLQIVHPGLIAADASLKNGRINIHMSRLRIQEYPGGGEHLVMVTFKALNQLLTGEEPVSFSQSYRVRAGETAGVTGYPMCIGLGVGKLGAAFHFLTVNVKDSADETALAVLDTPAFTGGLSLLNTAQPALKPFTDLTLGIAKQFATRHRNRPVQDCYLGLDFEPGAFSARLALGTYLAVQVPSEGAVRWDEWEYWPGDGLILNKSSQQPLGYNYLAFRATKYEA